MCYERVYIMNDAIRAVLIGKGCSTDCKICFNELENGQSVTSRQKTRNGTRRYHTECLDRTYIV